MPGSREEPGIFMQKQFKQLNRKKLFGIRVFKYLFRYVYRAILALFKNSAYIFTDNSNAKQLCTPEK